MKVKKLLEILSDVDNQEAEVILKVDGDGAVHSDTAKNVYWYTSGDSVTISAEA